MEFQAFSKMPRLSREIIITEKIDGTNAQVCIGRPTIESGPMVMDEWVDANGDTLAMFAGSRTRWVRPAEDNYGFAAWVMANAHALRELGEGRHYGEWWGAGIQRKYGQSQKRFSLFNVTRWADDRPACCDVVPVLYRGEFTTDAVAESLERLRTHGSVAAPGFMKPEGVVVYHTAGGVGFKKTIEKDEMPKGLAERVAA